MLFRINFQQQIHTWCSRLIEFISMSYCKFVFGVRHFVLHVFASRNIEVLKWRRKCPAPKTNASKALKNRPNRNPY